MRTFPTLLPIPNQAGLIHGVKVSALCKLFLPGGATSFTKPSVFGAQVVNSYTYRGLIGSMVDKGQDFPRNIWDFSEALDCISVMGAWNLDHMLHLERLDRKQACSSPLLWIERGETSLLAKAFVLSIGEDNQLHIDSDSYSRGHPLRNDGCISRPRVPLLVSSSHRFSVAGVNLKR